MSDPSPSKFLPVSVNVAEVVSHARRYSGELVLADLPRLADAVLGAPGPLRVTLQCVADTESLGRIVGSIEGTVSLTCQRCLQPMPWPLSAQADWTLVATEADQERLLDSRDPVLVDAGNLALRNAIEDEAIMALPIAPMCEDANCPNRGRANDQDLSHNYRPGDARPNPFAALKGQIKS